MLVEIKKKKIPILFYANKMDVANAMTAAEISKELDLSSILTRPWNILYSNN